MALVDRQYAGAEAWLERELVKQCGTWQQLSILKKKAVEEQENPSSCEGLTKSERLLWYRRNLENVELDNHRANCSSNYRQLQIMRGVRAVEETEEERMGRDRTKSEALKWYRSGGQLAVEEEKEMAGLCGSWKQFHLMTRGREEKRDEDQPPTRSERLAWYRNGGSDIIEARNQLARDSSNWQQYKLTRDRDVFAGDLEAKVNTRWSQFSNKEELSDYLAQIRTEGIEERQAVRDLVRSKICKETVTKTVYDINRQPWDVTELEEESIKKVSAGLSREERISKLRQITEEMLSHKSDYSQSARSLAIQAYKEADMEVANSLKSRKKVTIVSNQ